MARRQTLEEWIVQCVNDDQKSGKCYGFGVVHFVGSQPNEVDRIKLDGGLTPKNIAARFEGRIREYVRDMSGQQTCAYHAFYGTNSEPEATQQISVAGVTEYPGLNSEPPTEKGLLQQMMRHTEAAVQTLVQAVRALNDGNQNLSVASQAALTHVTEENIKLRHENADAYQIVREVTLRQSNEQFERIDRMRKEERNDALLAKLMQWAPALINTIAQKKVFPEATEDSAIVNGLIENMQPQHIQMLTALVPPEISGIISSRANELIKRRELALKGQSEAKQLSSGVDPESELQ